MHGGQSLPRCIPVKGELGEQLRAEYLRAPHSLRPFKLLSSGNSGDNDDDGLSSWWGAIPLADWASCMHNVEAGLCGCNASTLLQLDIFYYS